MTDPTGDALSPVEQAPQPVAAEPVAWRWSDTGSSQGYDTRFSEYPVNPSPYVSDATPLYEHPAPTEAPPVESQAAETAKLKALQSWVYQQRVALQTTDPDYFAKYGVWKAVGAQIRAALAAEGSAE